MSPDLSIAALSIAAALVYLAAAWRQLMRLEQSPSRSHAGIAWLGLIAVLGHVAVAVLSAREGELNLGFYRIASLIFLAMGIVSFSAVASAGWFTVPVPLKYGLAFEPSAILTVAFLYIITGVETIGDISGTVSATGRDATETEFRGGLFADGVISAFGAIFNAMPNTSYSQNVGLVNFTGVASRYVAGIGGVFLLILGFVPKIGAVVSAMPDAVLGGGALVLFAMIFSSGARIINQNVTLDQRNSTILALSMALGLGVAFRPEVLQQFPTEIQTLFGSALVTGGISALLLNIVIPGGGVGTGPTDYTDGLAPDSTASMGPDAAGTVDDD